MYTVQVHKPAYLGCISAGSLAPVRLRQLFRNGFLSESADSATSAGLQRTDPPGGTG